MDYQRGGKIRWEENGRKVGFHSTWVEVGAGCADQSGGGVGAGAGHFDRREANAGEEESEGHPRPLLS